MKKALILAPLLTLFSLACGEVDDVEAPAPDGSAPGVAAPDAGPLKVDIPDPNLDRCVRSALNRPAGALLPGDMEALTRLQCPDAGIKSLGGLGLARNLVHLSLWENQVRDISALAALTRLTSLQLGNNDIKDISALSKLVKLERLGLADNQIDDVKALGGLVALRWLNLDHNRLDQQDQTILAALKQLRWLTLERNTTTSAAGLTPLLKSCQVYMGFSSSAVAPPYAARSPFDLGGQIPGPDWRGPVGPGGTLKGRAGPGGEISFFVEEGQRRAPVINEFSGWVALVGRELRYRDGRRDVAIGEQGAGAPCSGAYASVCHLSLGRKAGRRAEGELFTLAIRFTAPESPPQAGEVAGDKDRDLLPYAYASPNQLDAGSCLFMANTGAMELLLNQRQDPALMKYQGSTDLSERFLMNASNHVAAGAVPYSITDVVHSYNALSGSLLNRDYPFTAGYVSKTSSGGVAAARSSDAGAEFSCKYNWIDELPQGWKSSLVPTPRVDRTLIFVDPKLDKNSIWRVGVASDDVVERIKWELHTKKAPVIVIYNHYLYWHASMIIGYDDSYQTGGCPMVDSMVDYFTKKGAASYAATIKSQMSKQGGCSKQGVFYVRDSIYDGGSDEPTYSYSDTYTFKKKYSRRISLRSYNWVKYVGNHAYTVHRR